MKQLRLLLTLCALVISTFLHAEVVSGTCGDDLTWSLNKETGILKIEGKGIMPNFINDKHEPDDTHHAPWYSLRYYIRAVELPEGLYNIGDYAFHDCSLVTSISIPNSVTTIGDDAFGGCCGLTSISIPNSVKSIMYGAFQNCSGLTSISIPNSVTLIVAGAFQGCRGLTDPIIVNDMFVFLPYNFKGAYSIPSNITKIIGGAFEYRSGLTSISIPNSVTSIVGYTFRGCSGLTSISIPNSVTSIGLHAFSGCSGLTTISIPNSVTSIGDYAFSGCSGLTTISIPNSVTSIGDYAFGRCSGLTDPIIVNDMFVFLPESFKGAYSIPNNITKIIGGAFEYCSGLTSISIPNSVTSIGRSAFYGCNGLTSISIPNSVTSIGGSAFGNCSGIQNFSITGENPPKCGSTNIFYNVDLSNATLYVPAEKVTYYQTTEPWTKFGTVKTLSGETPSTPTACAKPTISYEDGQLVFNSATTGAKYHCTITSPDMKSDVLSETGSMNLEARYDIAVYATAEGYTQSETATATLYWVKADGSLTDNINAAKLRGVVVTADKGLVSVSGLNDGEQVLFYATDGKMLGRQKAVNGTASLATSESVVICKVGTTSLKVLVK